MIENERVKELKQALELLNQPEELALHPWANSLLVNINNPQPAETGKRLADTLCRIFKDMLPGAPPRRGKRLDTRWGEFGILAAQYFAPHLFGLPQPASLREAWEQIDQAILLFVFGKRREECSPEEINLYKLVGDEKQTAAYSTISDWHQNGLKRLALAAQDHENFLSRSTDSEKTSEEQPESEPPAPHGKTRRLSLRWGILFACLLLISIFPAMKAWRIYQLALVVKNDLSIAKGLLDGNFNLERIKTAGGLVQKVQTDISLLRSEAEPAARLIGPWMSWLPVYGADLAASASLLEIADETAGAANMSYQALSPILNSLDEASGPVNPDRIVKLLIEAQPALKESQAKSEKALMLRAALNDAWLSSQTRAYLQKLDQINPLLQDALSAGLVLPTLLGATDEGPKTYLIAAQNEDELRATGGFITMIGSFVLDNGQVYGMEFQDSTTYEDWSKPYPSAPWQMQEFMDIPVMLIRDANWYVDFRKSAARLEYLYAVEKNHSADGIIAIDQQAIVYLLDAIGPVKLDGIEEAVTSKNVIDFMRLSKVPPPGVKELDWDRKAIIIKLASSLFDQISSGKGVNWQKLSLAVRKSLDEKHILLQFDLPEAAALSARYGWDGAVTRGSGDILMSVDTNFGQDKSNAIIEKSMTYDVNLTDLDKPESTLVVFYKNPAGVNVPCNPKSLHEIKTQFWYPMEGCYHNYLRVILPDGTTLLDAAPHAIPAEWMLRRIPVPARVDVLDAAEKLDGLQAFGTVIVVPGGETVSTSFTFSLPKEIISGTDEKTYALKIQKQPGTDRIPITLRIHLPASANVIETSPGLTINGSDLLIENGLNRDLNIFVRFKTP